MKIFYTPQHVLHSPLEEFDAGRMTPAREVPARVERVLHALIQRGIGHENPPQDFADDVIAKVHRAELLSFLATAHREWAKARGNTAAVPTAWPAYGVAYRGSNDIDACLGRHCSDTATPVLAGTWRAARFAANVALSGASALASGERMALALTRPPGHHASEDVFGGYCYLNNAAIAAQFLVDQGIRPAILDIDYHHGNGTQSIFYDRDDVYYVSLHANPTFAYPHYIGFADETGAGRGEGFNLNIVLPHDTNVLSYCSALAHALSTVRRFGPDILLVSLGLDTYFDDGVGGFVLYPDDYSRIGSLIGSMRIPTMFVFEGGYNISALGTLATNLFAAFCASHA
jgi:acetoin utilization deacetylase AcuC-like enzyme